MYLSDILAKYPYSETTCRWLLNKVYSEPKVSDYDNIPVGHIIGRENARRYLLFGEGIYIERFVEELLKIEFPSSYIFAYCRWSNVPLKVFEPYRDLVLNYNPSRIFLRPLMDRKTALTYILEREFIMDELTEYYLDNMRYVFGHYVNTLHHKLLLAYRDNDTDTIDRILLDPDSRNAHVARSIVKVMT